MAGRNVKIALAIVVCLVLFVAVYVSFGGEVSILGLSTLEGEEVVEEPAPEPIDESEPVEEVVIEEESGPVEEELIEDSDIVEEEIEPTPSDSESVEEIETNETEEPTPDNTTEPEDLPDNTTELVPENITEPEFPQNVTEPENVTELENTTEETNTQEEITPINVTEETNITEVNITNETITNQTIINGTIQEQLIQYDAVVNQPVKWKKTIRSNTTLEGITVDIHKEADNITIKKTLEEKEVEVHPHQVTKVRSGVPISGLAIYGGDYDIHESWLARAWYWLKDLFSGGITGFAIFEESEFEGFEIDEPFQELEIEYETPGPQMDVDKSRADAYRIKVHSDIHYENILAFVDIPNGASAQVYHVVNDSKELVQSEIIENRLQWRVPHLSSQEYIAVIQPNAMENFDTFVYQDTPNANYGGQSFLATGQLNGKYAGILIRFDLSNIPHYANINSAKIKLYFYDSPTNPANPINLSSRKITSAWDELTTTWNSRPTYSNHYSDKITLTNNYGWVDWNVTDTIQGIVNDSEQNRGIAIVPDAGIANTDKRFWSGDYLNASLRPKIEINYTLPNVKMFWPNDNTQHGDGVIVAAYKVHSDKNVANCKLINSNNGQVILTDNNIAVEKLQLFHKSVSQGAYKIHVKCTDVLGGVLTSDSINIGINNSKADIYGGVKDANGNVITTNVTLTQNGVEKYAGVSTYHAIVVDDGLYNITILPKGSTLKGLNFNNVNISKNLIKIIDIDEPTNQNYAALYAINSTALGFSGATINAIAKGDFLLKCDDWDFAMQTCVGSWRMLKSITRGREYNLTITPENSGFAEINIVNAEHLAADRTFIENIYAQVSKRDGVLKEIPATHYVRAVFEQKLDSSKDITIYAVSNKSGRVEVYEKDNVSLLADFGNISEDKKYRILLTNLTGTQDTFDLKVVNGAVNFDFITDPNFPPTHNNSYLNSTDHPYNLTAANLTCWNVSTADTEGDAVTNIFNWYADDVSLMVLNMPFNHDDSGGAGLTKDYSSRANTGTLGAALDGDLAEPTWVAEGKVGGAYDYDGADYIDLGDQDELIGPSYTYEFWAKKTDVGGIECIASKINALYNAGIILLTSNAGFYAYANSGNSDCLDASFFSAGTWVHGAVVFDGVSQCRLYKNGEWVDTGTTFYSGVTDNNDAFLIGQQNHIAARSFDGIIDEFKVYDRALSANQIKRHYLDTKNGYSSNRTTTSEETTDAEDWICEMTPNDGLADGITKNSTTLAIQPNTEPTHTEPYLNATDYTSNTSSANLTCWNQSTVDPNNNEVINTYNWYKDDVPLATAVWPFDIANEVADSETEDYSSRENHLTLKNDPDWTSEGRVGGAYIFDGGNDYLIDPAGINFDAAPAITIEMWVKPAANVDWNYIISLPETALNNGVDIDWTGTAFSAWVVTHGGLPPRMSTAGSVGTWYHIALTYDSIAQRLYKNGLEVDSDLWPPGAGIKHGTGQVYIGCFNPSYHYFAGTVDDVRIYNYALSATQIRRDYEDTMAGYSSNRTIVSGETSGNDRFVCEITPNDETLDGITKNSTELAINPPTHTTPYLNATDYPDNLTAANLTCWNKTTTDPDGDYVTNIFNWYKNDIPFITLNMPFDINTNSTAADAILDYSGHSNDGNLTLTHDSAGPFWTTGHIGGAYNFTQYGYIVVPSGVDFDTKEEITIEMWVNVQGNCQGIVQNCHILQLPEDADLGGEGVALTRATAAPDSILFYLATHADSSLGEIAAPINKAEWNHIVLTYDGTTLEGFKNGVSVGTDPVTVTGGIKHASKMVFIGASNYDDPFGGFNGTIDNLRIYNESLSATQIVRLYEDTKNKYISNSTITSDNTMANEDWICEITPCDATSNGLTKNSTILTILAGGGGDATKPTTNYIEHNATVATSKNDMVNWSAKISDNVALDYFHFRHNGTADASWVNDTITAASDIAGSPVFIQNHTKLKATDGDYVCGEFYFNDTSNNWNHTGYVWNSSNCFTLGKYIAIAASPELAWVQYGVIIHNTDDNSALKNYNGTDQTEYYIKVSDDTSVNVDFCIKGDELNTTEGDIIGLGNNTWSDDLENAAGFPSMLAETEFQDSVWQLGTANQPAGTYNWYRFWLDVPDGQDPGTYQNMVFFKAIQNGAGC